MTLSMKMFRDKVRFEVSDGEVESVVTLSAGDDEAAAVSKLKRIIALVESDQAPAWERQGAFDQHDDYRTDAPAVAPSTNGWADAFQPPALPERLKGEVELIQPGEDV